MTEEARSQESLHLATMVDKLGTYAHGMCACTTYTRLDTFPESIRASIGAKLRDFLDRNLEDA